MSRSRSESYLHVDFARKLLEGRPDHRITTFWCAFFDKITYESWLRRKITLKQGYTVEAFPRFDESVVPIIEVDYEGQLMHSSGKYNFVFSSPTNPTFEVECVCVHYNDAFDHFSIACVPEDKMDIWSEFLVKARETIDSTTSNSVYVVGGSSSTIKNDVALDDVVLPKDLKNDILADFESFFAKGVDVYKRLGLNPFRKILFLGAPGTGKTMLASALTNIAVARGYLVVYVSSSDRNLNDFGKIRHGLQLIANSGRPALLIIEEFDAYLADEDSRASVLNTLDGSEAKVNPFGTLLIATTNHPERIDDRVLRRPGRMDRIFRFPETSSVDDAVKLLQSYLREYWKEEHGQLADQLVGQPAAVVRELVIHALTMTAYDDKDDVSFETLKSALNGILEQIKQKDDFSFNRPAGKVGFDVATNRKSNSDYYVGRR